MLRGAVTGPPRQEVRGSFLLHPPPGPLDPLDDFLHPGKVRGLRQLKASVDVHTLHRELKKVDGDII